MLGRKSYDALSKYQAKQEIFKERIRAYEVFCVPLRPQNVKRSIVNS